ncbi:PfkB family carbohydrate kinase [candidate division KSB1 bacterium]|nr:PfkB family carbohydrate kinase [candidate division KSB1 bacterium]
MNEIQVECVGQGICAVDFLCLLPYYPALDEKLVLQNFSKQGGGPVPTALVTLARLGVKTAFLGKVGADTEGAFIIDDLRQEGVDTAAMTVEPPMHTPCAFIWIDSHSGKRTVVLNRTQTSDLTLTTQHHQMISRSKILLIDGWEVDTALQSARWARQAGLKIVADFGSVRPRMPALLAAVDYPVVSEKFVSQFWGKLDAARATQNLMQTGAQVGVVTCGVHGCFGSDRTGTYFQSAFQVPVVDTTGAGDVFHGAFIYGLLQHWDLPQILRFASAVAALKCCSLGGRAGIPNLAATQKFLGDTDK